MAISKFDTWLFFLVNHARHPVLDWLMPVFSDFGSVFPFLLVFLCYRLYRGGARERVFWLALIIGVILGDALCARVLKPLFGRPRPYLSLDHVYLFKHGHFLLMNRNLALSTMSMSLSWPSCHATNIAFFGMFVSLEYRKTIIPMGLLVFLVSYSRVYLGVHYPLDCLGGVVVGASLAFVLRRLVLDPVSGLLAKSQGI